MLRNLLPWLACLGAITLAPAGPQSALPASRRAIPLVVVTIRGEAQEEPGASSVVK